MAEIKKVIQRIYNFDLKNCALIDGDEMISTDHGNEFINTFIKRDLDKGIIVTPAGYNRGLVYKSTNNGEIYSPPAWMPDILSFSLNLYGLKKNAFYRISVQGRNVSNYNSITDATDDRSLEVSTGNQELLIKKDFSKDLTNTTVDAIFKASSIEEDLFFRFGKIYISDIIIDEVELAMETIEENEAEADFELDSGKSSIVGYGVFSSDAIIEVNNSKYLEIPKVTGKGLALYYDKAEKQYILQRDNREDTIGAAFTNANYLVDFNFNKAPYANYIITEVSNEPSVNTLKQGYIKFAIIDLGDEKKEPVLYDRRNGRLTFTVRKIN